MYTHANLEIRRYTATHSQEEVERPASITIAGWVGEVRGGPEARTRRAWGPMETKPDFVSCVQEEVEVIVSRGSLEAFWNVLQCHGSSPKRFFYENPERDFHTRGKTTRSK